MAKGAWAGIGAVVVSVLPHRVYEWVWEFVRSKVGEGVWEQAEPVLHHIPLDGELIVRGALVLAALWLFLPTIRERVPYLRPLYIGFGKAAVTAYEAAEKAKVLHVAGSDKSKPIEQLLHFKYVFLTTPPQRLFGVRPPSTRLLPIPSEELRSLYPNPQDDNGLAYLGRDSSAFVEVSIRPADLRRAIKKYLAAAKHVAKHQQDSD